MSQGMHKLVEVEPDGKGDGDYLEEVKGKENLIGYIMWEK